MVRAFSLVLFFAIESFREARLPFFCRSVRGDADVEDLLFGGS